MRHVRDTIPRMPNRIYERTRRPHIDIEAPNAAKQIFVERHLQLCRADPSRRNRIVVEVNLRSSYEIRPLNGELGCRASLRHDVWRDAENSRRAYTHLVRPCRSLLRSGSSRFHSDSPIEVFHNTVAVEAGAAQERCSV